MTREAVDAADPFIALVPADRRPTLTSTREPGQRQRRFDIRLQGE